MIRWMRKERRINMSAKRRALRCRSLASCFFVVVFLSLLQRSLCQEPLVSKLRGSCHLQQMWSIKAKPYGQQALAINTASGLTPPPLIFTLTQCTFWKSWSDLLVEVMQDWRPGVWARLDSTAEGNSPEIFSLEAWVRFMRICLQLLWWGVSQSTLWPPVFYTEWSWEKTWHGCPAFTWQKRNEVWVAGNQIWCISSSTQMMTGLLLWSLNGKSHYYRRYLKRYWCANDKGLISLQVSSRGTDRLT